MVFSSSVFLFIFLPITVLIYYLLRKESLQNVWLLFVSFIFFAWAQPNYLWIIIVSIILNYIGALVIAKYKDIKGVLLFAVVVANIGLLFYFKYFEFTVSIINKIARLSISVPEIILPIGISFFTFQGISYVIDVYRNEVQVQKNILNVALYISMFPQLIAGPIVRYSDINKEITKRSISVENISDGIEHFIIGLGKKVVIANTLASLVDPIWESGAHRHTAILAWTASIAYTLQIYFDFSGYSEMTIGLGKMLGFTFPENFNLPYISQSITEFWRRWHISLSSWFRDYIYIPLGGNRKRVYLNLFIVFLLTGIWHGASEHFILWGIWNGIFIIIERIINKNLNLNLQFNNTFITVLKKIYTLFVVNIGWVIFRAPYIGEAKAFISCMMGRPYEMPTDSAVWWYLDKWTLTVLVVAIIVSSSIPQKVIAKTKDVIPETVYVTTKYILLIILFVLSVTLIVSGTYNPFIYYQF